VINAYCFFYVQVINFHIIIIICINLGLLHISVVVSAGFDFCFLSTSQKIGWEQHLQRDLFCVKWDVNP